MPRPIGLRFALVLLSALSGCTPKIGDKCRDSNDCSLQGGRLCDTTQPGGYCTIFNCEPDTCPANESACVAFDFELDPACQSADDAQWARFQRTFCMGFCDDDSDCRNGYECVVPQQRSAIVVDTEPHDQQKICLTKAPAPAAPSDQIPTICNPANAGIPLTPYEPDGGGGTGGT